MNFEKAQQKYSLKWRSVLHRPHIYAWIVCEYNFIERTTWSCCFYKIIRKLNVIARWTRNNEWTAMKKTEKYNKNYKNNIKLNFSIEFFIQCLIRTASQSLEFCPTNIRNRCYHPQSTLGRCKYYMSGNVIQAYEIENNKTHHTKWCHAPFCAIVSKSFLVSCCYLCSDVLNVYNIYYIRASCAFAAIWRSWCEKCE